MLRESLWQMLQPLRGEGGMGGVDVHTTPKDQEAKHQEQHRVIIFCTN